MATLSARLTLLEDKQAEKMPMLPSMVVMPNQDHDASVRNLLPSMAGRPRRS